MAEQSRQMQTDEQGEPWRIELFGGLRAVRGETCLTRFRTRNAGHLLAFLACHPTQSHPREYLQELLWPECAPEVGRNRLKQELASLRRQLEPPGQPANSVLIADRSHVRLHPRSITSDVAEFENAVQAARSSEADASQQSVWLTQAVRLYGGPLLPGKYDEWILTRRAALQEAYLAALQSLTRLAEAAKELHQALDWALRAIAADPLSEEAYIDLIRLSLALGQPGTAWQHYEAYRQRLHTELDLSPSASLQELAAPLRARGAEQPSVLRSPPPVAASPVAASPMASPVAASSGAPLRLPMQFTRFFGRETEIVQLMERLSGARLVTLYGPGGSGKTRLAIEAARRMAPAYQGSVFFVGLADLRDVHRLADSIADLLRLPRVGRRDPLAQIASALAGTSTLLILDNLEQIADEAGPIVQSLLTQAPAVTCLVTSRQTLGIAAEQPYFLAPLPVPPPYGAPLHLLEFASVALFVDRAQSAQPDFQITPRNGAAIAAICQQLEGIPLALELAAAWSPLLTPRRIQERLSERFRLLVSRRKDLPERHRTLWAAVQWSYDLLPQPLQPFFARLSLFRGGWTLEAVQEICAEEDTLSALAELHQRALITTEASGIDTVDSRRGHMLETLREFAAAQLSAEDVQEFGRRHCRYFLSLAEFLQRDTTGPGQQARQDSLEQEHDNLRAALAWCDVHAGADGLQLALSLSRFWSTRGYQAEGRAQLLRFLTHSAASEFSQEDQARAHLLVGDFAREQGDFAEAIACARRSLDFSRVCGSTGGAASALRLLGLSLGYLGDPAAATVALEESVTLFRQTEDIPGLIYALLSLGIVVQQQEQYDQAEHLCDEALVLARADQNPQATAHVLNALGMNALYRGDAAAALTLHQESLALQRTLGNKRGIALSLHNTALASMYLHDYDAAIEPLQQSLVLFQEIGDRWGIDIGLTTLAALTFHRGDLRPAVRFWAVVADFNNLPDPSCFSTANQGLVARACAALGDSVFAAEWAAGLALTPAQVIAGVCSPPTDLPAQTNTPAQKKF